jgi:mannose-6-phosphate isomerase-like protein (cupin superfamily)
VVTAIPINVHVRSEASDGRLAVIEEIVPPGYGPPLHVHPSFDEGFYVLEGELAFRVKDELVVGRAGTFAFAPRGAPHTFANLSGKDARQLIVCAPGGFERYFDRLAAKHAGIAPPSAPSEPPPETHVVGPRIGSL